MGYDVVCGVGQPYPFVSIMLTSDLRFVKTSTAEKTELSPHWALIWRWSARNLSTPGTARAASYLLEAGLAASMPNATPTPETVDNAIFSQGLNGFCGLSDSSLSLWMVVLNSRLSENPGSGHRLAIRTANWLATNWTLRKPGQPVPRPVKLTSSSSCARSTAQLADCASRAATHLA